MKLKISIITMVLVIPFSALIAFEHSQNHGSCYLNVTLETYARNVFNPAVESDRSSLDANPA